MSTSENEQPGQPKPQSGSSKPQRTKKPRAERNPSHVSESQIVGWNEVRVEHLVTSALGKQAELDANGKEPAEDGSLLVDGRTCCLLEVKTQIRPGARPGRVRDENKPGKFRLMQAALDEGDVLPFAIIELRGGDAKDGDLPVRFALWPSLGKQMKWGKLIAGIQNVTDLTVERLSGLKDRIVSETEAYRRRASPTVFRQRLLDLEREAGEDIKETTKSFYPETIAYITKDLASQLPDKDRASTVRDIGGTLPAQDLANTMLGLGESLPAKDRANTVRGLGKTLSEEERAQMACGFVETLTSKKRAETVRGIMEQLPSEERTAAGNAVVQALPAEEQAKLVQGMLSGFTPEQREALLAQFLKGGA